MAPAYHRIRSAARQITCLILEASSEKTDRVQRRLATVSLNDKSWYETLSYSRVNQLQEATILLNDRDFKSTENLAVALRHLRREQGERMLWVDAICIYLDQS